MMWRLNSFENFNSALGKVPKGLRLCCQKHRAQKHRKYGNTENHGIYGSCVHVWCQRIHFLSLLLSRSLSHTHSHTHTHTHIHTHTHTHTHTQSHRCRHT